MKQQIQMSVDYIKSMDTFEWGVFGYGFILNAGIWSNVFSTIMSS